MSKEVNKLREELARTPKHHLAVKDRLKREIAALRKKEREND